MSYSIIGIGETLWDLFPDGPRLGGAPANFACHAQALGAKGQVITRVGQDQLGRDILDRFREMNLPAETVQLDREHPTGTVTVALSEHGIPHFTIHEEVAWDYLSAAPAAMEAVSKADAICFGALGQRNPASRLAIQRLVAATPENSWRVFDVNLRQRFYSREVIESSLRLANVLKINDDELSILSEIFALGGGVRDRLRQLSEKFHLKIVVLTSGSRGSLILGPNGEWSEQASRIVQVIDTVGAGDAFSATLVTGLLSNLNLDEAHAIASDIASYVCSQSGATPPLPKEFRDRFAVGGVSS